MRIALCTPYPINRISGISTFVGFLRTELRARGYDAEIVAPEDDSDGRPGRTFRLAARTALTVLRSDGLDIVHANQPHLQSAAAFIAARIVGARFVATYHSEIPPARRFLAGFLQAASHRLIAAFGDAIVFVSQATLRAYGGRRSRVIYLGVDATLLRTPRPAPSATSLRLVFAGRQTRPKGFFDLLDAVERVVGGTDGRIRLTLIGDTPADEQTERDARVVALGEIVDDLGRVEPDKVVSTLAESDAIVLPSYREGLPLVLMEAMALGCVPVATRVGGIPELVSDGTTGLLLAPGDLDALASAISTLMKDTKGRMDLSDRARSAIEDRFLFSRTVDEYIHLYEALVARAAQRPTTSRQRAR